MSRLSRPRPARTIGVVCAVLALGTGTALAGAPHLGFRISKVTTTQRGQEKASSIVIHRDSTAEKAPTVLPLGSQPSAGSPPTSATGTSPAGPAAGVSSAPTSSTPTSAVTSSAGPDVQILPNTLSGADFTGSFWSTPLGNAPLATDSAAIVANIAHQVSANWGGHAAFNDSSWTTALYTVSGSTPRQDLIFDDCQNKGYTPAALVGPQGWFTAVPIPDGARPAGGSDSELTIWQPSTETLWEFWQAKHQSDGWHACWGGRLDKALHTRGMFPGYGGATATGLPLAAGMVTMQDVRQGHIDHAVDLEVIDVRSYPAVSWPAQRTDGGSKDPTTPLEGQRLRLDPTLDVGSLKLTPLAAMIARAAQTYGFVIMDKSGSVAVEGESGVPLAASTGTDPWPPLLGKTPGWALMDGFPWDRLQALPIDYGK